MHTLPYQSISKDETNIFILTRHLTTEESALDLYCKRAFSRRKYAQQYVAQAFDKL